MSFLSSFADVSPYPTVQSGFFQTNLGFEKFVRTERYQETPAANMGGGFIEDTQFAQANNDLAPHRGWNRTYRGWPDWRPLWAEPEVILQRKQLEYELNFLSPHGEVEDILLHRRNLAHAPIGVPYLIPTEKVKSNPNFVPHIR
jgi:hypothetical protein